MINNGVIILLLVNNSLYIVFLLVFFVLTFNIFFILRLNIGKMKTIKNVIDQLIYVGGSMYWTESQ